MRIRMCTIRWRRRNGGDRVQGLWSPCASLTDFAWPSQFLIRWISRGTRRCYMSCRCRHHIAAGGASSWRFCSQEPRRDVRCCRVKGHAPVAISISLMVAASHVMGIILRSVVARPPDDLSDVHCEDTCQWRTVDICAVIGRICM